MNYGEFLRVLKKYCINKSINNEILVNEPIEIIIEKAKIKKSKGNSKGEQFYYESTEACRIINNKLELSDKIRSALQMINIEEEIIDKFDTFYENYIDKSKTKSMIDEFLLLIKEDDAIQKYEYIDIKKVRNNPSLFLAKLLISSLKQPNLKRNICDKIIWQNGNSSLEIIKGDLFTFALGKRMKKKRIVVIPANTTFTTTVSTNLEKDKIQTVSTNTIHGSILTRLKKSGINEEEISQRIYNNLFNHGLINDLNVNISLPIGSIAAVDINQVTLYFLAISKFDKYNNAHSSKDELQKAIIKLLHYYDKYGQGYNLYLPLMGTGMSRINLSYQDSLDLITSTLLENKNLIHGKISIVIQPNVIDTINLEV